jgi:hypothetical protein
LIRREDFADARARWLAGLCPCCGGEVCEHHDGTEPAPIAEGVMICGRCIANYHLAQPDFVETMLASLLA